MPKFVILENGQKKVVELVEMLPNANVVAEVIEDMVFLKNPVWSIYDSPENMFAGKPIPLDEFMKQDIK